LRSDAKVLIVEDNIVNLKIVQNILNKIFDDVLTAKTGNECLDLVKNSDVDLILLDVGLLDINGFEVARKIKRINSLKSIPIIFITSDSSYESIEKGFEVGCVDYIKKPINAKELTARVKTHVELKLANDQLVEYKDHLEVEISNTIKEIKNLNNEIEDTQREVIFTMGAIGESRSKETGNHVKRVAEYSYLLAILYGLDENEAKLLKEASPMHDIGKVAIPDSILNKPAKLTEDEFTTMKTHAKLGYNMLAHSKRPILKAAAIIAHEHHEKYNGTGYPRKLTGEDIHIYGRITAVADVFDALGSDRCYKKAWELDKILNLFQEERAKHFDPKLVDIFIENLDSFLEIRDKFKD
jgi:putative two-component system response regulator